MTEIASHGSPAPARDDTTDLERRWVFVDDDGRMTVLEGEDAPPPPAPPAPPPLPESR